jgi:uncharacterized protein YbbK (DUF523 family)
MRRIAVSACLLGEEVRYDGSHRLCSRVRDLLAADDFETVPFCPEQVMGVPRPPFQLHRTPTGHLEAIRVEDGGSVLPQLRPSIETIQSALTEKPLHGIICKSRSPSCGLKDVNYNTAHKEVGPGLFILAMQELLPGVPIIDENGVADSVQLAEFLRAVRNQTE